MATLTTGHSAGPRCPSVVQKIQIVLPCARKSQGDVPLHFPVGNRQHQQDQAHHHRGTRSRWHFSGVERGSYDRPGCPRSLLRFLQLLVPAPSENFPLARLRPSCWLFLALGMGTPSLINSFRLGEANLQRGILRTRLLRSKQSVAHRRTKIFVFRFPFLVRKKKDLTTEGLEMNDIESLSPRGNVSENQFLTLTQTCSVITRLAEVA